MYARENFVVLWKYDEAEGYFMEALAKAKVPYTEVDAGMDSTGCG